VGYRGFCGNKYHGGSFLNTCGGWDTLIGVGREEISTEDQQEAEFENSGGYGFANNGDPSFYDPGMWTYLDWMERPSQMGRVGGVYELYAYEMQTIRNENNFCIGRYEKFPKTYGAEDLVLAKAGSGYTSRGKAGAFNQPPREWPWTLGWRGYVTSTNGDDIFPYAIDGANGAAIIGGGLDNALPGDIGIAYAYGGNKLPLIFFVTSAVNTTGTSPSVNVVYWDQGKNPTSAYSTDAMGMGGERTIYKTAVPHYNQSLVCAQDLRVLTGTNAHCNNAAYDALDAGTCMSLNCQPSCIDSNYKMCVLGWMAELSGTMLCFIVVPMMSGHAKLPLRKTSKVRIRIIPLLIVSILMRPMQLRPMSLQMPGRTS